MLLDDNLTKGDDTIHINYYTITGKSYIIHMFKTLQLNPIISFNCILPMLFKVFGEEITKLT